MSGALEIFELRIQVYDHRPSIFALRSNFATDYRSIGC